MELCEASRTKLRIAVTIVAFFISRAVMVSNGLSDESKNRRDTTGITRPAIKERLDLSGHVYGKDDQPISNATIVVWTAGVRVGTSSFCPSCYADCGKRAETDAAGAFALRSLDGDLVFQLVVVAEGYKPQYVESTDPAKKQSLRIVLQTSTQIPDDPKRKVYGQLVNKSGDPIAGALVSPFGCKTDKQRWWGTLPGVDPLAVTNSEGKFMITTQNAVQGLDLELTVRGLLKRKIDLAASGTDHRFEIISGARVRGRVVKNGQPAPNILVGIAQKSHSASTFLGTYQIGTDGDGRFDFFNLPTDDTVVIYGIIDNVRDRGAIPVKEIRTSKNEELTDIGDLQIEPGHEVSGRVLLSDGKPVPPRTTVTFSRQQARNSTTVEVQQGGAFRVFGLPSEQYSVSVRIPEYRLSVKNRSLNTQAANSLHGIVDSSITDLLLLLEPGEPLEVNLENVSPTRLRRFTDEWSAVRQSRLMGVTSSLEAPPPLIAAITPLPAPAPKPLARFPIPPKQPVADNSEQFTQSLQGKVVDALGKPVRGALLAMRVDQPPNEFATALSDSEGRFELKYPAKVERYRYFMEVIWCYAEGQAIASASPFRYVNDKPVANAVEIALGPLSDTGFVVLGSDGLPVPDAIVEPYYILAQNGANDFLPEPILKQLRVTTDVEGKVRMPAASREDLSTVQVTTKSAGIQRFRLIKKATEPAVRTLQLQPTGRIEGQFIANQKELFRDMKVYVTTERPRPLPMRTEGFIELRPDQDGRFSAPAVMVGSVQVRVAYDPAVPARVRLPPDLYVDENETTQIWLPLESVVRVTGSIRTQKARQPIANVDISILHGDGNHEQVQSDMNGSFSASVLPGKISLQVINLGSDYVELKDPNKWKQVPDQAEFSLPPIEVLPAVIIRGRLVNQKNEPLVDATLHAVYEKRRCGAGFSDQNGSFEMNVPAELDVTYEVWPRRVSKPVIPKIVKRDPLTLMVE